ncbi:unnamed protein product [Rhizophagus irregularis]|nr:unnamed protein product [Rhizophagus irregularis]
MSDNNFNYDTFVRNPPNPNNINDSVLNESLFSFSSNSLPLSKSFNISSFNVNGLKMYGQTKIEQISAFFSLKHISFCGIVDTHLSPKQMKFLSKRISSHTVFSSNLDNSRNVHSSGGVSLFIENTLASHVQDFKSISSRLLSVDLYFKGNVKLRIFVVYIPPSSSFDASLRADTIELLIKSINDTKQAGFYHAICGDFNMHLDKYYPIFYNQPQIASKRAHRLFYHLLSHGYEDCTPVNLSASLGTFRRDNQITRVDYVWSCPMLKGHMLTSLIFDAQDICTSDHNPIITYYDLSLLFASTKMARARQLKRCTRRVFKFDSVSDAQWTKFSESADSYCDISPAAFSSWHINRMCEYLQSNILKAANATLPSAMVGNNYTPKVPKDLEILTQHYRFLNRLLHSIRLLRKYPLSYSAAHEHKWSNHLIRLQNIFSLYKDIIPLPPTLPSTLSSCRQDAFSSLLTALTPISKALHGLHLIKEKELQESSIRAHLDDRDNNFDTDISSFIDSALARTRRRITLDRVFVDHPDRPQLLTDPKAIDDAVVNHFQNFVPIHSSPPSSISDLPARWSDAYQPLPDVSDDIYDSLMNPPFLDEWLSAVSSMPNDKAAGPSMITYEMLKHLGPRISDFLLILIQRCLLTADIPDLWRQAMVFPIPKPHEWKCQLKNTRPITLLEVIRKTLVKLFYNRLSSILAEHEVLQGGNFAGLPGGSCRDPIITLESIIHDAQLNKNPLWVLSQDISKAFDSVDLSMLRFALQRIRLPPTTVNFLISLFTKRTNRVFTAYGVTPSYRVRIGIDQGEVISPLLWVIYIDPLLTVLKNEMNDPYVLSAASLSASQPSLPVLRVNNLVFMDDSTLISSTKSGMESMLSITEEFYAINNTSANHSKYVLITNSLSLTSASIPSPIVFNLKLSSLNRIPSISITPISMTTSFRFLGVWFNINSSRDFVKKQINRECNSFAATVRPAKLSAKQVVYLHNTVLVPKLEYRMQVTHLSEAECLTATRHIRSVVKHKGNFSRSLPNPILYLSQALGLINLYTHQQQCHLTNLFLMANSSSSFIQNLFIYRLRLIQFSLVIPISPLLVQDWSIWSSLFSFKKDYIACTIAFLASTPFHLRQTSLSSLPNLTVFEGHTPLYECMTPKIFKSSRSYFRRKQLFYLSQLVTPQGTHLISWATYLAGLVDKRGKVQPHSWFLDLQRNITIPDSNDRLFDQYFNQLPLSTLPSIIELQPCNPTSNTLKRWIVTLDDYGLPTFGKQLAIQLARGTSNIVHWVDPSCVDSPGNIITLTPCPGCDAHDASLSIGNRNSTDPLPRCTRQISNPHSLILETHNEKILHSTTTITSPFTWADIEDQVRLHYSKWDMITPDFSPIDATSMAPPSALTAATSAELVFADSPIFPSPDSCYKFYTDGSLINLGTPEVSMGWSWVQIVHDAGFYGSIASHAYGTIKDWPSSSRAEAAAIYAALTVTPPDSTVKIYTDSQTAMDGLRLCASSSYMNSRIYYKTTNFELWAIIENLIIINRLIVLPIKVKAHSNDYWNDFADSLANTAHTSSSILISGMDQASPHDFVLSYDDVVCESNPRRLFKQYSQTLMMRSLLQLTRFNFIFLLSNGIDYIVDWELTWCSLRFEPSHDASFTRRHASRHSTFKYKLFLDELPTLEKLKLTRPDLYMDELTCRSCIDHMEDLMHLFMCKRYRLPMLQILHSYQKHLISKIQEAGAMADIDPAPFVTKLLSLSCWSFSSTNWSSYGLIRGCLPKMFVDIFVELTIPRSSAMKVVAAIHNNFIQKFRKRVWNPRSYEKSRWEDAMNITQKIKTSPRPSNLPKSAYLPFSTLPPPTLHVTRNSETDWLKNSMKYAFAGWSVDFYSGRAIRYYVSIVASTLVGIYQGGRSGEI